MSINARFASFRPRKTIFSSRNVGVALRRAAATRASALSRFRVVTAGRLARGLPATRGFRPLGLRSTGEKKVIDNAVATYQINTGGSFTLLNGCIQGSDYSNRIGRKILNASIYIRGIVHPEVPAGAATSLTQLARMIVFVDMQPNGAAPAVTDLLNSANSSSQLNLNNRDRFKILRDETYSLGATTWAAGPALVAAQSPTVADVNVFKKLSVETIFNAGNAGTIADMNSGAIYMFWIGNQPAGAGTDGSAIVSTRIRFLDP